MTDCKKCLRTCSMKLKDLKQRKTGAFTENP